MNESTRPVSIKLVTIVVAYEGAETLARELRELGVTGYTTSTANGWGVHGARSSGLLDGANVRLEVLVRLELADRILEHIETKHGDEALMAFAVDAVAVPSRRFSA